MLRTMRAFCVLLIGAASVAAVSDAAPNCDEKKGTLKQMLDTMKQVSEAAGANATSRPAITAAHDELVRAKNAVNEYRESFAAQNYTVGPAEYAKYVELYNALKTAAANAQTTYDKPAAGGHAAWEKYVETFKEEGGEGRADSKAADGRVRAYVPPPKEPDIAAYRGVMDGYQKLIDDLATGFNTMDTFIGTNAVPNGNSKVIAFLKEDDTNTCYKAVDALLKTDPYDKEIAKVREERGAVSREEFAATRYKKPEEKPATPGEYFKDEERDGDTGDASNNATRITIKRGGNLWEVARQLAGRGSNAQVAKLVERLKQSVRRADGKLRGNAGNELMPGDTIDLADLPPA